MKISILTPNLSGNCLGRAFLLAKVLQRHYEVEIIGPLFHDGIWEPLAQEEDMNYKGIKVKGLVHFPGQVRGLLKLITGDVVFASKPLSTSFGIGLLKKITGSRPLVLDIDDWQMGFIRHKFSNLPLNRRLKGYASSSLSFYSTSSYWNTIVSEKLIPFSNEITVSNKFLQKKYGGSIIWHARDTEIFNPEKYNRNTIREKHGISRNEKVVMFLGTPRPYKGVEDIVGAISLLQDRNIVLIMVGMTNNRYSRELITKANKQLKGRVRTFGLEPFSKAPEYIAMGDVIIIPQRRNLATIGQVPAKIFDAMAMAKPVIATAVSDLPEILNGCGWIVEPERRDQIAEALQYIIDNPDEADDKGKEARKKCIEKYSYNAIEDVLVNIFRKYE